MNSEFSLKYPEIEKYPKTEYQKKIRKLVFNQFLNDFDLTNSNLYVVERFQNRGGHHVITKHQTVMIYFWQDDQLLEVYHVKDNYELEARKEQNWGTDYIIPTLEFIQENFEKNQLDSIKNKSENIKYQFNHPGEFFITELDNKLNVLKAMKCEEFEIE